MLQTGKSRHFGFIEFESPEVVLIHLTPCFIVAIMFVIKSHLCVLTANITLLLKVAKIVADTMHNYLLFEHLLQVFLIPPEHVHPKL